MIAFDSSRCDFFFDNAASEIAWNQAFAWSSKRNHRCSKCSQKIFNTGTLLERLSMPIPTSVVDAIWTTLTHMDQKLANYTPSVNRGVEEVENTLEPTWISSALDGGNWSDLVNFSEQRFVHIRLLENQEYLQPTQSLRVGLIYKGANEERLPSVEFYSIDTEEVISKTPLHSRMAWRIKLPDPMGGQRMVLMVAYDVTIDNAQSILLCTSGNPASVVLNLLNYECSSGQ